MDNSCPKCGEDLGRKIIPTRTKQAGIKGFLFGKSYSACPYCSVYLEPNPNPLERKAIAVIILIPFLILPFALMTRSQVFIIFSAVLSVLAVFFYYYSVKTKLSTWQRWQINDQECLGSE